VDEGAPIHLATKLRARREIYHGVSYHESGAFSGRDHFGHRFLDKDEFESNVNGYLGLKYKETYHGSQIGHISIALIVWRTLIAARQDCAITGDMKGMGRTGGTGHADLTLKIPSETSSRRTEKPHLQ
jgi:hypothetical protein